MLQQNWMMKQLSPFLKALVPAVSPELQLHLTVTDSRRRGSCVFHLGCPKLTLQHSPIFLLTQSEEWMPVHPVLLEGKGKRRHCITDLCNYTHVVPREMAQILGMTLRI